MEPAGPYLHRPGAPLCAHIDYIGYWRHDGDVPHRSTALPRGAVTVVLELSGRDEVPFAPVGSAPVQTPSAFVTGAGTTSYVTRVDPGQTVMTVHFRPAGARSFLGFPLGELQDRCIGIDDVWGHAGGGSCASGSSKHPQPQPDWACWSGSSWTACSFATTR